MEGRLISGTPAFTERVRDILEREKIVASTTVVIIECDVRTSDAGVRIAEAARENPGVSPVIVCSPKAGPKAIRRAVDAGADAIIWSDNVESLSHVLRAAVSGYICLPRELKRHVSEPDLTRREKQVLGQVVLGLSNREIASTLGIRETTVKSHVRNSLTKLGAESRVEATRMILDPNVGLGLGVLSIVGNRD